MVLNAELFERIKVMFKIHGWTEDRLMVDIEKVQDGELKVVSEDPEKAPMPTEE